MKILFTGHRDRTLDVAHLITISEMYPDATWLHGGANGFDNQVAQFAAEHGIPTTVVRPDYQKHSPRIAPIIRNEEMVKMCDLVVACYDGRKTGGTQSTIEYAIKSRKTVISIYPKDSP